MKRLGLLVLVLVATGCGRRYCSDGEKTGGYRYWSSTTYKACHYKCTEPDWDKDCACTERCPCHKRHPAK